MKKIFYIISIIFVALFIFTTIKSGIFYYKWATNPNEIIFIMIPPPFYTVILSNALKFLIPALISFTIGKLIKNRNEVK